MDLVARGDGNGLNPLLQYPEMVIHPPNLYSGYTGFYPCRICISPWARFWHAIPAKKWISPHPQMDHDCVGFSGPPEFYWAPIGPTRFWVVGGILGLGSRRKCFVIAVAYRHRVSALRDDGRKSAGMMEKSGTCGWFSAPSCYAFWARF